MNSLIPAASYRTWHTQDTSFNISILFQVFKTCGDHNWTLQEEQNVSSSEIFLLQSGQIILLIRFSFAQSNKVTVSG